MTPAIQRAIEKATNSIRRPFRVVLTLIKLASAIQLVQAEALAGETLQDNELMQHYGYTSAPPAGTQGIVIPLGGKTAHGVIIATEHGDYRFKLQENGEVALYTDEGDHIYFKRGRILEIETETLLVKASTKVRLETPLVETTGNLKVDLDITDRNATAPKTMAGMRTAFNNHRHPETGSTTGTTDTGM